MTSIPSDRITAERALHALQAIGVDSGPVTRSAAVESGRLWRRRYQHRLLGTDIAVVVGAVAAIAALTSVLSTGTLAGGPATWLVAGVVLAVWLFTLAAFRTRDPRVIGIGLTEYKRLASSSLAAAGGLAIIFLAAKADAAQPFILFAFPLGLIALLGERWLWRKWLLRMRTVGHYLSRAVVVGNREDVEYVIGRISANFGASYAVVGAIVDDGGMGAVGKDGVPIVGTLADAANAASRLNADAVIVAGQPSEDGDYIRRLGWQLEGTDAELVLSRRLTDVAGPRIHFRPVEGLPLIHVEIPTFDGGKHALKRAVDVALSACALLVLAPVFLVIAIAIRMDDGGPVLFRQERCGRSGQTFRMIKFRSMVTTAESDLAALRAQNEGAGVLFKLHDDPRVTRVGRVLRKYSLDELPQIWNILIGEMSIVGPRPPLPAEVDAYETDVHRRLYIKPGLTGMWQVNGRSDLDWDESVRLDLYYVENWSLTGDLVIMWRTLKVLVHPRGAY
ncbi:MAG: sugar transferase [Leifsonia sp.]